MQEIKYTESEKLKAISEQSQLCGEFLEWLMSKYNLIDRNEKFETPSIPIGFSSFVKIDNLLAEFFDIDMSLVEKERIQMIEEMRNRNG
jgi:hypothetical protein